MYFGRVRFGGKLIRRSLKTTVLSVARLRLADFVRAERERIEVRASTASGKLTFGQARRIFLERLDGNAALKPAAKLYRRKCAEALVKTWPDLDATDVRKISEHDCLDWAARFGAKYSPSVFNNTVGTLRQILALAVAQGARYGNPASTIKKQKIRPKVLVLPTQSQFTQLLLIIESAGAWCSRDAADLVRFLAFGGFRKSEAAAVKWSDIDFDKGEILVRGDAETGTKNWAVRRIPMIPDMRALLVRLRSERRAEATGDPVMKVRECQKALDNAARKLDIPRFTHHDLRHLFATRCIESGVDIPTVSRWLGHKDGGALAMRVYGHLRDQHSASMAGKVTF